MRLIDVVVASVVAGAAAGLLPTFVGSAAEPGSALPHGQASRSLCERLVWLRAPAMHAATRPTQ